MRLGPSFPRTLRRLTARLLAAGLLTLPALAAATPAHAAATSGINDFSCQPSTEHPRPLILLHGTFVNPAEQWAVAGPYFAELGYCVFELDYGQYHGLPLVHGIAPIEDSARQLAGFVDQVLTATGKNQVDIVGHSQGGGALPRYYMKFLGGATKVHTLVGIAPVNHGGTASGLFTVAQQVPGATDVLSAACPACTEMFVGSPFDQALNADGDTEPGVRYTTIVTRVDEFVTPYGGQFLTGTNVQNVVLQDLCPLDVSEHVLIGTVDGVAFHEAANALDPDQATPTTCADLLSPVLSIVS